MSLGSRLVAPVNSLYVDEVIGRPAFLLLTWLGAVGVPLLAVLVSRLVDFGEVASIRSRRRYRSPGRDPADTAEGGGAGRVVSLG